MANYTKVLAADGSGDYSSATAFRSFVQGLAVTDVVTAQIKGTFSLASTNWSLYKPKLNFVSYHGESTSPTDSMSGASQDIVQVTSPTLLTGSYASTVTFTGLAIQGQIQIYSTDGANGISITFDSCLFASPGVTPTAPSSGYAISVLVEGYTAGDPVLAALTVTRCRFSNQNGVYVEVDDYVAAGSATKPAWGVAVDVEHNSVNRTASSGTLLQLNFNAAPNAGSTDALADFAGVSATCSYNRSDSAAPLGAYAFTAAVITGASGPTSAMAYFLGTFSFAQNVGEMIWTTGNGTFPNGASSQFLDAASGMNGPYLGAPYDFTPSASAALLRTASAMLTDGIGATVPAGSSSAGAIFVATSGRYLQIGVAQLVVASLNPMLISTLEGF